MGRDRRPGSNPPSQALSIFVTESTEPDAANEIVVYWRPGCGLCRSLRQQLDQHVIPHRLVNIWEDDDAAAMVRSVARGYETVPTVVIGDVALVNPTIGDVLAAAAEYAI